MIHIHGFPLPPSSNHCYPSNFNGRRFKSQGLKKFEHEVCSWIGRNWEDVQALRTTVARWQSRGLQLRVDCYFAFAHDRVWTLKDTVKTIDASNFVKPCHDALAAFVLQLDDRHFFTGLAEKVTTAKENECTTIVIAPYVPMTLTSTLAHLKVWADGASQPSTRDRSLG